MHLVQELNVKNLVAVTHFVIIAKQNGTLIRHVMLPELKGIKKRFVLLLYPLGKIRY